MLNEKFHDIISHEGVVSIVTWGEGDPHIANTWNSYLRVTPDERLLAPVGGMRQTQQNIEVNPRVKMALGSRDVMGFHSMGTGFSIEGTAKFLTSGPDFAAMKEKFPWLRAVLEVTPTTAKQTL